MKKLLYVALALLCVSKNLTAGNLFVSIKGNDHNPGTMISQPLLSINTAIQRAQPGDTVFILPGVYQGVIEIRDKKGIPDTPVYLMGYSTNVSEYPTIDGGAKAPSDTAHDNWIEIENSEWLEIGRLNFVNGWVNPIRVKNSSYISVADCRFTGGRHVVYATGERTHHLLIENCFWDQGGEYLWTLKHDNTGDSAWYSMHHGKLIYFNGSIIDFRGTSGSIVVRRNKMQHVFNAVRWVGKENMDSNIEIYENDISFARDNDFEPENYTYNLHIYHNISHNIHKTLSVDNVLGGYIYYYGNVITTDEDAWTREICNGFWKLYGIERKLSYPLTAFNNSFFGTGQPFVQIFGPPRHFSHFNNAYFLSEGIEWELNDWDSLTEQFDYDISNKEFPPNIKKYHQEQHGKVADIGYVNPRKRDLHLLPTSPGIDAGTVMQFPELGWSQSYAGSAPDAGAYENGKLVEGPPFRFRIPPGGVLPYQEKPRISRHSIRGKSLVLYFSDGIDTTTLTKGGVALFSRGKQIPVASVRCEGNYSAVISAVSELPAEELSIAFHKRPRGLNGEPVTSWASTIKVQKK